jgi:predicted DNA-binding mobile mystery protein A
MGVSQPTITQMEHNEVAGSITLATLERAANALGCKLTYAFVPEIPLETRVTKRAEEVARRRLQRVGHTMALENQAVDEETRERQVREVAARLLQDQPRRIWDEP